MYRMYVGSRLVANAAIVLDIRAIDHTLLVTHSPWSRNINLSFSSCSLRFFLFSVEDFCTIVGFYDAVYVWHATVANFYVVSV